MARWLVISIAAAVLAAAGASAATARTRPHPKKMRTIPTPATLPLQTALADPLFDGPQAADAFSLTAQTGATYVRVPVHWDLIAPWVLPDSGFDPTDPTSTYYDWSSIDALVAGADAAGLTPILNLADPPPWAYSVPPTPTAGGTPDVTALGQFATALATHFDGTGTAPAAHVIDVWNEPNFNRNLSPQDPATYLLMVNAVADAAHAVDPNDIVVAGELAPFKHKPSATDPNSVTPPLAFMRAMLCISNGAHPHRTCNAQAHFDVWSHHPYSDTGPFGHARTSDGVELGDLPKMNALLQAAQSLGAIVSAKPVQFWVTEIGWSSDPPKPKAVPMTLLERWMAESLWQVWRSGASLATWFVLQDEPSPSAYQSGLYFQSDSIAQAQPKPILTPFRFPFVAYLQKKGNVQVWGRDATSDTQLVTIQRRIGARGAWKVVAQIRANGYGIFEATLPLKATKKYWLRAVAPGSGTGMPFSLTVPKNENALINPWGNS